MELHGPAHSRGSRPKEGGQPGAGEETADPAGGNHMQLGRVHEFRKELRVVQQCREMGVQGHVRPREEAEVEATTGVLPGGIGGHRAHLDARCLPDQATVVSDQAGTAPDHSATTSCSVQPERGVRTHLGMLRWRPEARPRGVEVASAHGSPPRTNARSSALARQGASGARRARRAAKGSKARRGEGGSAASPGECQT